MQTKINNSLFIEAKLQNVDFTGADLSHNDFSRAKIQDTCLRCTILHHTNFSSAICDKADFRYSSLQRTDFSRASLENALFHKTNLSDSIMPEKYNIDIITEIGPDDTSLDKSTRELLKKLISNPQDFAKVISEFKNGN